MHEKWVAYIPYPHTVQDDAAEQHLLSFVHECYGKTIDAAIDKESLETMRAWYTVQDAWYMKEVSDNEETLRHSHEQVISRLIKGLCVIGGTPPTIPRKLYLSEFMLLAEEGE